MRPTMRSTHSGVPFAARTSRSTPPTAPLCCVPPQSLALLYTSSSAFIRIPFLTRDVLCSVMWRAEEEVARTLCRRTAAAPGALRDCGGESDPVSGEHRVQTLEACHTVVAAGERRAAHRVRCRFH